MPGQRLDYSVHLGQARCHAIVRSKFQGACNVRGINECWEFTGSKNTDGYGQVFTKKNTDLNRTGRNAQTAFLLHVISYVAAHGNDVQFGDHISHLCDNRSCFNPDHLVGESADRNNSRKGCPGPIFCSDHGHLIVDLCTHTPRCIRDPRSDVRCCLSIKESDPGWSSQRPQDRFNSSSRPSSSHSMSMRTRSSSEYGGAQWLIQAIADGDIEL